MTKVGLSPAYIPAKPSLRKMECSMRNVPDDCSCAIFDAFRHDSNSREQIEKSVEGTE
jgi:hypothetical protein